jgi:hypothetical protein
MSTTTSAIERLQGLPQIFRGADLTVRFAWSSKTASQYLYLWKKRGLVSSLGGHSDVFANLLRNPDPDWELAARMAMPSAILIGVEVLRRAGWTTQIPRVPTIAVKASGKCYATPHFQVERRSAAWFDTVKGHSERSSDGLPSLSPAWALADLLARRGWLRAGIDPDDLDLSEVTEADRSAWTLACKALAVPVDAQAGCVELSQSLP